MTCYWSDNKYTILLIVDIKIIVKIKIAVLGTGIVGRTIAEKLDQLGHDVTIGTRDVQKTMQENEAYAAWASSHSNVHTMPFVEGAANADLLFNCIGGMVTMDALNGIGEKTLGNKVLVDLSNPLDFSNGMPPSLGVVNTDSIGEQIQRGFPNLKVVKSLNTMNTALMVNPGMLKGDHNVFVCGNDEASKNTTLDLLKSFGWREDLIIDLGDITNSRGTEMILPIWLRLWGALGTAEFNFHIQKN